jgi:hypothetical protein
MNLKLEELEAVRPEVNASFDPRVEVSADAKYIVKNLVLWFLIAPIVLGILAFVLYNAAH